MCALQVLRHDIGEKKKVGTISEAYPHLIVNQFSSKLGQRVGNILKYLFPAPKVNALSFWCSYCMCWESWTSAQLGLSFKEVRILKRKLYISSEQVLLSCA